jgi:RNA polymerase sigma factor (sigma-70 family)
MSSDPPQEPVRQRGHFPTTSWTVIRTVREGTEEQARAALESFCRTYWYPVYAYCRRSGFPVETAKDLTQTYFQQLIGYESMKKVDPERGKLRYFVLSSVKRLIANHLRHENARKRGAGEVPVSLSLVGAEEAYLQEPSTPEDASRLFDRAWAERVAAAAEDRLHDDYAVAGTLGHFEVLRKFLPHRTDAPSHREAAAALGLNDGSFRLHLHRLRKRFADYVEEEIARTVSDPEAVREEVAYLVDLLAG